MPRTARKPRPYFTLVDRVAAPAGQPPERWAIQFGDYDRATVAEEMRDMKAAARRDGERREWLIVKTADARQPTVDAAVAALA